MPRRKRARVSGEDGSYHIISRTAGDEIWFDAVEKEYLMDLLEHFASGFYVHIHSFCIMSTHIHILLSGCEKEVDEAEDKELLRRYHHLYGKDANPPSGSYHGDGSATLDDDGGLMRLRRRLGSVSRFVQELKQTFSRWYNKCHERKGYLWGDRFKGVIVDKGGGQLACSAYIDLNPVRGGIVRIPEDYRWSSMGFCMRNPDRYQTLLTSIFESDDDHGELQSFKDSQAAFYWYREFVHKSGAVKLEGKSNIPADVVEKVGRVHGRLGIGVSFRYRIRNISEGVAIGSQSFIADIQRRANRKFIRPRPFFGRTTTLYATRVLRL